MDIDQDGKYYREIIQRDGMGQTKDDYHATVTRLIDESQLVFLSDYKWLLKWKTRRKALDRAFDRFDKRELKLAKKDTDLL
jgi:hypothetical protein